MESSAELVEKKAKLITAGEVYLEPGTRLPYYPSKSTGGPDAGRISITLALEPTKTLLIKLALTDDPEAPYKLSSKDPDESTGTVEGKFQILHEDQVFIDGVLPVPTLLHAPGQAFINLTPECIYNCLFCASPELGENARVKARNLDEWVDIILDASKRPGFRSVAITSGVPVSPGKTVDDIVYVVKKVRAALPDTPIGVEPCIDDLDDIRRLHQAGTTELKINIQTYDPALFELICPGLDLDFIMKALEESVSIFGRNRVCSNLIIGLGESDESVRAGIEHLSRLGVVVNLRVLRLNDYNRPKLRKLLPSGVPEPVEHTRLMYLVRFQGEMFEAHGLSAEEFHTMCHRCGACDIDPGSL